MSMIDDIKSQFLNEDEDNYNENLPWENNNEIKCRENTFKFDSKILAKIGMVVVAILISIYAIFTYFSNQNSVNVENASADTTENSEEKEISVHIAGEVKHPGVYKINCKSRIIDAVNLAGGFTENADQSSLNLAKNMEDGEQIIIASLNVSESTSSAPLSSSNNAGTSSSQNNGKVNINTADSSQLQTLSGIGPSTAQKIIDYRNSNGKFKSIDEIKKVSGIGEKTFAKFADKICV